MSTDCRELLVLLALAVSAGLGCSDASNGATPDETGTTDVAAADVVEEGVSSEPTAEPLTSDEVAERGAFGVGVLTLRLEDTSRPTAPNGDYAGAESRMLVTEVWYPATQTGEAVAAERGAEPAPRGELHPLIVYSHGFMSTRRENEALATRLASHGFVVAAPDYPLTNMEAPGGPNLADVANQPADVRFLIDQLLEQGGADDSGFGAIDPDRVALMGVSLGALTSLLTTFYDDYRDPRVMAVLAAAAPGCFLPSDFFGSLTVPVLLLHGDLDEIVPYAENAPPTYAAAHAPKWLVTLVGGTHTAFGAVAADILSRMDNPEAVGCVALGSNESIAGDALATLAEDFGVSPEQAAACPSPCSAEGARPTSMNAQRQLDLLDLVAVAFFEEQLAGDARFGRFLDETLASEQPDVTVQVER